jgi:hypothetical protein
MGLRRPRSGSGRNSGPGGGETRASRDRKDRLREALFLACALSDGKAYPSMIPDRTDNPRKMILLTGEWGILGVRELIA